MEHGTAELGPASKADRKPREGEEEVRESRSEGARGRAEPRPLLERDRSGQGGKGSSAVQL
jgi:hypothetical protein